MERRHELWARLQGSRGGPIVTIEEFLHPLESVQGDCPLQFPADLLANIEGVHRVLLDYWSLLGETFTLSFFIRTGENPHVISD